MPDSAFACWAALAFHSIVVGFGGWCSCHQSNQRRYVTHIQLLLSDNRHNCFMSQINPHTPKPHHVAEFKRLIYENQGIELTDQQAQEQCANLVKYIFLAEHALPALMRDLALKRVDDSDRMQDEHIA
jgi:hypothetical protein